MSDLKTIALSIFPERQGQRAAWISLNDCALRTRRQPEVSQFLTPRLTDRFLAAVHRRWGVDYSLTPYPEDRAHVWRGSYLKPPHTTHVAIDVNVPVGTAVSVAHAARVVNIVHDPDQKGGWGTAVIFALEKPRGDITHFIYAHLAADVAVKIGDGVQPGEIVGRIGDHHENGGWYQHLHVQAVTAAAWQNFRGDLGRIDGYMALTQPGGHPDFPDPMPLLAPIQDL